MIIPFPEKTEACRLRAGKMASRPGDDFGSFYIRRGTTELMVIACNEPDGGIPWEHVSARARDNKGERAPTWDEMCYVKSLFWGPEECVIQYHPPASEYVNSHPHVLHLWRYTKSEIPRPPRILV